MAPLCQQVQISNGIIVVTDVVVKRSLSNGTDTFANRYRSATEGLSSQMSSFKGLCRSLTLTWIDKKIIGGKVWLNCCLLKFFPMVPFVRESKKLWLTPELPSVLLSALVWFPMCGKKNCAVECMCNWPSSGKNDGVNAPGYLKGLSHEVEFNNWDKNR